MLFSKKQKKREPSKHEALLKELLKEQAKLVPSRVSSKDIAKLEHDLAELKKRL